MNVKNKNEWIKKMNEWMSELFNWEKNNLSLLLYCWTNTDDNLKILWVHRNARLQFNVFMANM